MSILFSFFSGDFSSPTFLSYFLAEFSAMDSINPFEPRDTLKGDCSEESPIVSFCPEFFWLSMLERVWSNLTERPVPEPASDIIELMRLDLRLPSFDLQLEPHKRLRHRILPGFLSLTN